MKTETQKIGQLTSRIKKKSVELLGYEMSVTELRLLPYIQYSLVNEQRLELRSLNEEEMGILASYARKGYIVSGVSKNKGRPMMNEGTQLRVTRWFWNAMLEILWLGYVDLY